MAVTAAAAAVTVTAVAVKAAAGCCTWPRASVCRALPARCVVLAGNLL